MSKLHTWHTDTSNVMCGSAHFGDAADQDIIAKLPSWDVPQSYQECIATGRYDLLSCSAADRAAGEYHSASVLHVPSKLNPGAGIQTNLKKTHKNIKTQQNKKKQNLCC